VSAAAFELWVRACPAPPYALGLGLGLGLIHTETLPYYLLPLPRQQQRLPKIIEQQKHKKPSTPLSPPIACYCRLSGYRMAQLPSASIAVRWYDPIQFTPLVRRRPHRYEVRLST
jgi:hypothetical protein